MEENLFAQPLPLPLPIANPLELELSADRHALYAQDHEELAVQERASAERLRAFAAAIRELSAEPAAAAAATSLALGWAGTAAELVAEARASCGPDEVVANRELFERCCPALVPLSHDRAAIKVALSLMTAGWAGTLRELAETALAVSARPEALAPGT